MNRYEAYLVKHPRAADPVQRALPLQMQFKDIPAGAVWSHQEALGMKRYVKIGNHHPDYGDTGTSYRVGDPDKRRATTGLDQRNCWVHAWSE